MLDYEDVGMVLYLARCTLAKKPGKNNWVEEDAVDGLPEYICRIARAIHRDGSKSISQSIAIAVGRVKAWSRGEGGVTAKTRALAAKAVAEWERKKKAAKLDNKVKASNVLMLTSYNIDAVRKEYFSKIPKQPNEYRYIREMWNDHFIVAVERESPTGGLSEGMKFIKVPYSVDKSGSVTFGEEVEVKQAFVTLSTTLTDAQLEKAALIPCTKKVNRSLLETVALSQKLKLEEKELLMLSQSVRDVLIRGVSE